MAAHDAVESMPIFRGMRTSGGRNDLLGRMLSAPMIVSLGRISYGVYLYHLFIPRAWFTAGGAAPREHWAQIASTNPLERVNREVKRRSDVIGIFPNDEAIVRLVGALMLETNDEWAVARRYMSLETLARVTDNPTVRLPAVAT